MKKQTGKRILEVKVKRMIDDSPDTSWLGEYSSKATSRFSIDRMHALDCPINLGTYVEHDPDTHECEYLGNDAYSCGHIDSSDYECCSGGNLDRNEYRYFNPSFNYVDAADKIQDNLTEQEVRDYVRQDYKRMEAGNRGDWCMLGIAAEAEVQLTPNGPIQRIRSGGLWGIESDSEQSYLEEVESEQLSELKTELIELDFSARAISKAFSAKIHKDAA